MGDAFSWDSILSAISERYLETRRPRDCQVAEIGKLSVFGLGLSLSDITAEAEENLRSSDVVFYLVYDQIHRRWIEDIRADALDLYSLYSENINRHFTYVRMAEAMLIEARKGRHVSAFFYGHPGVFATPAHRAVKVARQEGIPARMYPGVSALDYLVADLGIDPAIPGLQSFEATDLLLRSRVMDPSLHQVIWQVGLVGNLGFQQSGLKNPGFKSLIDEIERVFGGDWSVTHYIASSVRAVSSTVEELSIDDIRRSNFFEAIGPLSTFYIRPRTVSATNMTLANRIVQRPEQVEPRLGVIDYTSYSDLEKLCLANAVSIKLGTAKRPFKCGLVSQFVTALASDQRLAKEYITDPSSCVDKFFDGAIDEQSIKLLKIPHRAAINAALRLEASKSG